MKVFPDIFNKRFGRYFKLVTKNEFEKYYLHAEQPVRFVGDYVALAISNISLWENRNCPELKSHHAGITDDETQIPIIQITL